MAAIWCIPSVFGELYPRDVTEELKKLSLEELLNLDVTTVTRRAQRLAGTPASAVLITRDEIRRSGARSIPEALRLAPNLHVAQVDSRGWAISARGFNGTVANKLHVMIDGRSVYTPLFSGVFWDVQDTFIEDIERIEVISGPAGTLWGANAVNGVINVVTRDARHTQGTLISGGGGNFHRGFGGVRHGGRLSDSAYYRVYGKYFNRGSTRLPGGGHAGDSWQMGQGGFRVDWDASASDIVILQGDIYGGAMSRGASGDDISVSGGNILGRWTHQFSFDSSAQLQVYYDRTYRNIPGVFSQTLDTYDLDWQHHIFLGDRHHLVWGAGYRLKDDRAGNTEVLAFIPAEVQQHLFTWFLQDEIALMHERLYLTLGSKFEHNAYTGLEYQPGGRLGWHLSDRHFLWAAVSRAVRTPSRIDRDFHVPGRPPFTTVAGGPGFTSERLLAYEAGYRARVHSRVSLSVAPFYHDYDQLRSVEPRTPFPRIENGLEGESYGVELQGIWEAADWWRWQAGYTRVRQHVRLKDWSADLNQGGAETAFPQNQLFLRTAIDLPRNVEFDTGLRFVDRVERFAGGRWGSTPGYVELDARLGWHVTRNLEMAVAGQNLIGSQHPEFGLPSPGRPEIPRSIYGQLTFRF